MPDLGASCIETVVDCLVGNTVKAAEEFGFTKIALAGGVSANSRLRARMQTLCGEKGWQLYTIQTTLSGFTRSIFSLIHERTLLLAVIFSIIFLLSSWKTN